MKLLKFIIPIFFCNTVILNASSQTVNDSIEISLLTASPGNETYSAFGHSALRVYIPSQGINIVYNYGTFDFDTPNFYLKFSTGKLMYYLSWAEYEGFLYAYNKWGQALYEQKLLLSRNECEKLVQLLNENFKEENRYYRYGFFYDNCATRIRDIIEKTVDGKIIYDTNYVTKNESFRQLIGHYLGKTPWIFFGINLLLGTGTDSIASINNYMFLPEHLRDIFAGAVIQTNGSIRKLTAPPVELFPSKIKFSLTKRYLYPESVLLMVFALLFVLTIYEKRKKIRLIWLDRLLFIATGIFGLLLTALWIWSLHHELENNFNVMWASPLNFIIGAALFLKSQPKWLKYLIGVYAISLLCFIPVSFFITQSLPEAAYPFAGIMLLRSWCLATFKNNN